MFSCLLLTTVTVFSANNVQSCPLNLNQENATSITCPQTVNGEPLAEIMLLEQVVNSYAKGDKAEEIAALEYLVRQTGHPDYWLDLLDTLLSNTDNNWERYAYLRLKHFAIGLEVPEEFLQLVGLAQSLGLPLQAKAVLEDARLQGFILDPNYQQQFFRLWNQVQEQAQTRMLQIVAVEQSHGGIDSNCQQQWLLALQLAEIDYFNSARSYFDHADLHCTDPLPDEVLLAWLITLLHLQEAPAARELEWRMQANSNEQRVGRLWQLAWRRQPVFLTGR